MKTNYLSAICFTLILFASQVSRAELVVGFDGTSVGGWTTSNPGILTPVTNAAGTGVAGIEFNDQSNGPNFYVSLWTGDLSAEIGQTLRFGLVFVQPGSGSWVPASTNVEISDGTTTLSTDLSYDDIQPVLGVVLNQNVALNAATFGTDIGTFSSVMGNVDTISIRAEQWDANGVEGYLTNQSVPEPSSGLLFAFAIAAFGSRRRREHLTAPC